MPQRKEPAIPNEVLDQLLAGGDASAAFDQVGLLHSVKKAVTERALNAQMDHHLAGGTAPATRATATAGRP
jgi:putative transposase